ncbi:MAG: ABC transporter permease [Propionibacteriaceae bacterium]|jgi:ribose transport system permease protein|nr:ABC transporter permease [Propionibacteriaceae bacterium]
MGEPKDVGFVPADIDAELVTDDVDAPEPKSSWRQTASSTWQFVKSSWTNHSYIFVFVVVVIVYAISTTMNGKKFNTGHISSILSSQNTVIVGTMAIGMALVIITGQIDLSIGSALVLTTGVTIVVFNVTNSIPLMILAALGAGAVCGAINGFLAAYVRIPPFIVTLGTMLIYRSITLWAVRAIPREVTGSGSSQFSMLSSNSSYQAMRMTFGTSKLTIGGFEFPYVTMLFLACLILFVFISKSTKYGKAVYAVGSNEKAARLSGVNTQWIKASVFIVTGLLVGVASIIQASKVGNITPASSGRSYEMYAIAAVVLGGIAMSGGRGNILGVLFGALSYATINFIIVSIPALSADIQDTFQGLVLILVIMVQTAGPAIRERFRGRAKAVDAT